MDDQLLCLLVISKIILTVRPFLRWFGKNVPQPRRDLGREAHNLHQTRLERTQSGQRSLGLRRPFHERQGDRVQACQETLGRRTGRLTLRLPCRQPGPVGALRGESPAPDTCPQGAHASRSRQPPPQAGGMVIALSLQGRQRPRPPVPSPHAPLDALGAARGHHRRRQRQLRARWRGALHPPSPAAPRCGQSDRGHPDGHRGLAVCRAPRGPRPGRAHDAGRDGWRSAPPPARRAPIASAHRHHRLPSGRDRRTAWRAAAALGPGVDGGQRGGHAGAKRRLRRLCLPPGAPPQPGGGCGHHARQPQAPGPTRARPVARPAADPQTKRPARQARPA